MAEGFRVDNPCDQIKLPKLKTLGFHTWDETEIAQFEKRHAIGTRARLALALLLYTAQRRGDVVRMGRQHLRDGVITVRQQKTGAELEIPAHAVLRSALAGAADNLTFLLTERGLTGARRVRQLVSAIAAQRQDCQRIARRTD